MHAAETEKLPTDHYYQEVEAINDALQTDISGNIELLEQLQVRLDSLAEEYRLDQELGADLYALEQAQALIYYRQGRLDEAVAGMQKAIATKGATYAFAEEFLTGVGAVLPTAKQTRVNRMSFFVSQMLAMAVYVFTVILASIILGFVVAFTSSVEAEEIAVSDTAVATLVWTLYVPYIYYIMRTAVLRLHDLGHSGWLALISFVPLANFVLGLMLTFLEGQAANKFGAAPGPGIKLVKPLG